MRHKKCILLKLVNTPVRVKARIVGDPRRKGLRHCVVVRDPGGIGWKKVYSCDEYELALAFLEKVITEL